MRRALKTYPVIAIDVEILPCSSHLPPFFLPLSFSFFFPPFPLELLPAVQSLYNLCLRLFRYLCLIDF